MVVVKIKSILFDKNKYYIPNLGNQTQEIKNRELPLLQLEDEITNNPLSKPEGSVDQNSAEVLYATMLPSLPQVSVFLIS